MRIILVITYTVLLLLSSFTFADEQDHLFGLFGWQETNPETGEINGLMLHILNTNKGPHAVIQCKGSVPLVIKLEGSSPEYSFSIDTTQNTECLKTDYVIKLRGHDVLLWTDKNKKSHATVLPRIKNEPK